MDQQIFDGAVDFESRPQEASLGASAAFLSAILIHFNEAPTTAENLIVSYMNEAGEAYTTELHKGDPSVKSTTDLVLEWNNGFALDPGDSIKIAYPNTDGRTIGITVKYRHF